MVNAQLFPILITFVITAAATPIKSVAASSDTIEIERDVEAVTLTYARYRGTCMQVETSTDLVHWVPTATVDTVREITDAGQVVASRVPHLGAQQMFFRLLPLAAHDVTLTWNQVTDGGVAGYRLHYRTRTEAYEHVLDVGLANVVTVSLPNGDRLYSFAVTSYDASGLESAPSDAVTVLLK